MSELERHTLVHQAAYGQSREEKLLALSLLVKQWERDRLELADLRGRLAAMTDKGSKVVLVPHSAARAKE